MEALIKEMRAVSIKTKTENKDVEMTDATMDLTKKKENVSLITAAQVSNRGRSGNLVSGICPALGDHGSSKMEVETVKLTPAAKSSASSSSDSIWTPTVKLTPATAKGLVLKEAPSYRQKDPFEEYDPWATSSKYDDSKPNDAPNPWAMTRRKSW